MVFSVLILIWLCAVALWLLRVKRRADRELNRRWYDFGDFQVLVVALVLMAVSYGVVNTWQPVRTFRSSDAQLRYGYSTRQPWLITKVLWGRIARDPENLRLHDELSRLHFMQQTEADPPPDQRAYNLEGVRMFSLYTRWAQQTDNAHRADIGNLFLAWYYLRRVPYDHEMAALHLRQVQNTELPFVSLAVGKMLMDGLTSSAAVPHLQEEIERRGGVAEATELLARCYATTNDTAHLYALVRNPATTNYIEPELRYAVYYKTGQVLPFYALHFQYFTTTLSLWGVAGGLLILAVWLVFLRRLGYLQPLRWSSLLLAAATGAVLALGSWWGYAFLRHTLGFSLTGAPGNDLLYCLFGIGLTEELVKLLAFLLLLHFTRIVKRPVDYLLVASATGLGFAFFENLLYVSRYGLDVLHARAITASVAHMVAGATAAYGFVLVRCRRPNDWWLIPVFFLAAAFSHGFYDFWLLSTNLPALSIFTLLFFLVQILLYALFLNNALNQTALPGAPPFRTQRLAAFLAGALVLVFVLEFISVTFVYGTAAGNRTVSTAFLSGGFLVFFLSVHLSNITLVPGAWFPPNVLANLLPRSYANRMATLPVDPAEPLVLVFRTADGHTQQLTAHVLRFASRHTRNDTLELYTAEESLPEALVGATFHITAPDENNQAQLLFNNTPSGTFLHVISEQEEEEQQEEQTPVG